MSLANNMVMQQIVY